MRLKNKFVIFCLAAMSFTAVAQTGNPSQERPDTRLSVEECLEMAEQKNASVLNSRLDEEAALAQKREALGSISREFLSMPLVSMPLILCLK